MFIIQNFLKARQRKIDAWYEAREKWVNSAPEGVYRYPDNYSIRNPFPVRDYSDHMRVVGTILLVVLFAAFISYLIDDGVKQHKADRNATTAGKNCRMFNREDTIRITTGEYKDTQGKIVGGCNKGDDYQIKLADGSFADVQNDGEGRIAVGTRVVAIGSYKDLVVIEEPKNAEPESK